MHNEVLRAIAHQRPSTKLTGDVKEDDMDQATIVDFVNANRDFSKIKASDLEAVFLQLKKRCPKTWTHELEMRAKELNQKFMTIKKGNAWMFIDPEMNIIEAKTDESEVIRLMTNTESWSMETRERAIELCKLLHHFTTYAPFEGRPFVRAWLEALTPCFARWILLSNTDDYKAINTLKHFLGAFGQPGIVVCLPDKGARMLKILKNAARSVEALGRGTVERHYWKRLAESSFSEDLGWHQLAGIKEKPLTLSQLDCVTQGWLSDANDWCEIFAHIVSPEISKRFKKRIVETFKNNSSWNVHPGPPKMLARCLAKGREYMSEYEYGRNIPRWKNFEHKFKSVYKRSPNKPEDFIWNVVDFARCSITVPDAEDVMKVKHIIEQQFSVISVKNCYNPNFPVKRSGYRDLKLLIEMEFDALQLDGVPNLEPNPKFICEVQILSEAWLHNKKTTSMAYKILRAKCLRDLFYDAAKYVKRRDAEEWVRPKDVKEIIKNGWLNLVKAEDLSKINADSLLLTAADEGWSLTLVNMLIKDLGANTEAVDTLDRTPLLLACWKGRHEVAKCLIQLKCNIEHREHSGNTALIYSVFASNEMSVRILLSAGVRVSVLNHRDRKSALDYAVEKFDRTGSTKKSTYCGFVVWKICESLGGIRG